MTQYACEVDDIQGWIEEDLEYYYSQMGFYSGMFDENAQQLARAYLFMIETLENLYDRIELYNVTE